MATSVKGFKLRISGFIIPFFIVFNPVARLQVEQLDHAIGAVVAMVLSLIALSTAIYGYFLTRLTWAERLLTGTSALFASGFMTFLQKAHIPLEWPMLAASVILFGIVLSRQVTERRNLPRKCEALGPTET
jgi:TRAP-type uncharacterized transport system fused permease subunit